MRRDEGQPSNHDRLVATPCTGDHRASPHPKRFHLQTAVEQRHPEPGVLHHSDQGSTYASGAYQEALSDHDMICSMSRKGNCWENAVSESFFSTPTSSAITRSPSSRAPRHAARSRTTSLGCYNPTRLHSYLGYMSPMDCERDARNRCPPNPQCPRPTANLRSRVPPRVAHLARGAALAAV